MWSHMFVLTLPVLEKMIRPVVVYFFLIFGLRIAGKRELAQLNPFDLVVLLTLSNTLQNAIIGEDNTITGGFIGAATLLALNYAVVRFLYSHKRLDRLIEGRREVLIHNGQIVDRHCERELITKEALKSAMHRQGIASLHDVQEAVLEPCGTISFIQKRPTPETSRHAELMETLHRISADLGKLQERVGSAGSASA